ncbi:xanthine dehydrogenase family protein subunit M [Streptomyces sp. HNM0575]|uniref:FAD binding domain-containing protein n=1 Tax=Streptomyces sp. HNM0575 TaxID=2716338 RepID=UPI00145CFDEE|nr:xanthine dehydrogenase family protein subunit M [Streptomyces sp. HNM0575]
MIPFRYERPDDTAAAVDVLSSEPGAAYLGGGTNLVDLMKLEVARHDVLVDVRGLTPATIDDLPGGGLRIGASVSNSRLAADPRVRRRYPMLSQAVLAGASGQLRNMATCGGNLMQRTRCVYFQDLTTPCNKREPGTGCSAAEGHNRDHAILGASPQCVATHPSDMGVALTALDAVVRVQGPDGERAVPFGDFHRLPGDTPQRDTLLGHGELITAIDLPHLPSASRCRYRKIRDRASYAFALVSAAVALEVRDGAVHEVRIGLGGVAHKPWRASTAEETLLGRPATAASFLAAAEAELAGARPLPGNRFKVPLARNVVVGMLNDLAEEQL